ncbi:MAG TPA: PDZ domain-containing protein [Mesorhizobium sp.]|jgi:hypothetical protein|nr:PDZ domain-containing protein [Mesorhizobium sp.]
MRLHQLCSSSSFGLASSSTLVQEKRAALGTERGKPFILKGIIVRRTLRALRALSVAAPLAVPLAAMPAWALTGDVKLPAPSVSRALDAILLPINDAVATAFKLNVREGLLVLATEPGGVADKQGIEPGDVLVEVGGRKVTRPVDVDVIVRRGLRTGDTGYLFGVSRGGSVVEVSAIITIEFYEETFSVSEISTWESWSVETSFSYSEFISEYSETIETSYQSEETVIEQEASVETTEESSTEAASDDDSDDDGTPDASDADDDNDGTPDDADTDDDNDGKDDSAEGDNSSDDSDSDGIPDDADTDDDNDGTADDADADDDNDGVDDSAEADDAADDGADADDSADDGEDDGGDDEVIEDDSGDDEGGADDGGDDGE